jgi:hypothetical protein
MCAILAFPADRAGAVTQMHPLDSLRIRVFGFHAPRFFRRLWVFHKITSPLGGPGFDYAEGIRSHFRLAHRDHNSLSAARLHGENTNQAAGCGRRSISAAQDQIFS